MKKINLMLVALILLVFGNACKQNNKEKQVSLNQPTEIYLSLDKLFEGVDSLENKTVNVEGTIAHVCKRTMRRFKIVDGFGKNELKIELGEKFPLVDESILGNKVKVKGKLIPVRMDEKEVKEWETRMKESHKGEEHTAHYKEEIAFIQSVYNQLINGEIPYYTTYHIDAEQYSFE